MATPFEPLNRSLETFLTRLSRTNERSEKSRRVFKKPRCYKDESDGCIDTWIEVMKLHIEEEDLSERQECSALTSNLEGTALNCVMAKKQYQRDTAEKIFEILLNRFGSGVQGHQAMMRFDREFIKGYADKVYPMQKLMRNKGKKFEWSDEAQTAFENIKRELCEAPVLGMPTEKGM